MALKDFGVRIVEESEEAKEGLGNAKRFQYIYISLVLFYWSYEFVEMIRYLTMRIESRKMVRWIDSARSVMVMGLLRKNGVA